MECKDNYNRNEETQTKTIKGYEIEVIEKEEVEIIEEVTKEEVIKEKEPDKVIKLDTIWEIEIQEEENKEDA